MNAVPPSFTGTTAAARGAFAHSGASATSMRWTALADAANVVATLAGLEPERTTAEVRNFLALVRDAEAWRREQAENGIADLAAVMEPGIAALLALHARGTDSRSAAMALWREFTAARGAILSLLPASGDHGPRRMA